VIKTNWTTVTQLESARTVQTSAPTDHACQCQWTSHNAENTTVVFPTAIHAP